MKTPDMITIHRNSISDNPDELQAYYKWEKAAYHFIVTRSGEVIQWGSLIDISYHAGINWNRASISIAVHGDFRYHVTTGAQQGALFELCELLCHMTDIVPARLYERAGMRVCELNSHEELATAEGRVWRCPGGHLDVAALRRRLTAHKKKLPSMSGMDWGERVRFVGWR